MKRPRKLRGSGPRCWTESNRTQGMCQDIPKEKADRNPIGFFFGACRHPQRRAAVARTQGFSNGSFMSRRSLRVSTSTSGPSSSTTGGLGSRGTWMGLGSAAMAA